MLDRSFFYLLKRLCIDFKWRLIWVFFICDTSLHNGWIFIGKNKKWIAANLLFFIIYHSSHNIYLDWLWAACIGKIASHLGRGTSKYSLGSLIFFSLGFWPNSFAKKKFCHTQQKPDWAALSSRLSFIKPFNETKKKWNQQNQIFFYKKKVTLQKGR